MTQHAAWHTEDPALTAYLDGNLGRSSVLSMEAHLLACSGCRERLALLDRAGRGRDGHDRTWTQVRR